MATDDPASLPAGMPRPGDALDGKYSLVRVIGAGGMGVVYEAEHLRLKQRCAIKMLSPEMLRDGDIVHRFEREARASAVLKGPHVTRVNDVATTPEGVPYIVMELMTGQDLDGLLSASGKVPFAEAVDYVLQACAAIAEAHAAGIIHRDLKPGNLFLAREDEGVLVKVLDFGISKILEDDAKLTSAGATMGTALYMSPEQLRSASTVDARSDIWSLGIILYELISGATPFVGSVTQVAAAIVTEDAPDILLRCPIPPALAAAIHRALQRKPSERFADVAELAAAIAPFAPADSVGSKAAANIARRSSTRRLPGVAVPSSSPRLAGGVDAEARTVARDVATGVSHVVNNPGSDVAASRKRRLGILAALALGVTVAVSFVVGRPLRPAPASGATSTTAAAPSAEASGAHASPAVSASSASRAASATDPTPEPVTPDAGAAPSKSAGTSPSIPPARPAARPATTGATSATRTPARPAAPATAVNPTFL